MDALEGVRLIDFGQYLAGPFGPMVIGDLGADVIKVEPVRGDGMRMVGGPFFGCQRGKRCIALDLKNPRGVEIALQLVANGMVATVDDPELGRTTQIGTPINLLGTPGGIRGPQPMPGEHNREILGAFGYSDAELATITGGGA